jgi:hypothetical protein
VLIIFNPAAGAGRRRRLARALGVLRARGVRVDLAETRAPGDAEALAREAARSAPGGAARNRRCFSIGPSYRDSPPAAPPRKRYCTGRTV